MVAHLHGVQGAAGSNPVSPTIRLRVIHLSSAEASDMSTPITTSDPHAAVRQWFTVQGPLCVAVDYASTRSIFAPDVVSFGTKAEVISGLDSLQRNQWENIRPKIRDFHYDMDSIHSGGDERHAWGIATCTSTGFDENGRPFSRPCRATVILERRDDAWLCVHTHFSLFPGTPLRLFEPKG